MTDTEFMDRAETLLKRVEALCDHFNETTEVDIDNQRVGGMITLTFANRSQIVINLQKPLHEIWLATRSGGYHYRWQGESWEDTKGAGPFWGQLSSDATAQAAQALTFSS